MSKGARWCSDLRCNRFTHGFLKLSKQLEPFHLAFLSMGTTPTVCLYPTENKADLRRGDRFDRTVNPDPEISISYNTGLSIGFYLIFELRT